MVECMGGGDDPWGYLGYEPINAKGKEDTDTIVTLYKASLTSTLMFALALTGSHPDFFQKCKNINLVSLFVSSFQIGTHMLEFIATCGCSCCVDACTVFPDRQKRY